MRLRCPRVGPCARIAAALPRLIGRLNRARWPSRRSEASGSSSGLQPTESLLGTQQSDPLVPSIRISSQASPAGRSDARRRSARCTSSAIQLGRFRLPDSRARIDRRNANRVALLEAATYLVANSTEPIPIPIPARGARHIVYGDRPAGVETRRVMRSRTQRVADHSAGQPRIKDTARLAVPNDRWAPSHPTPQRASPDEAETTATTHRFRCLRGVGGTRGDRHTDGAAIDCGRACRARIRSSPSRDIAVARAVRTRPDRR